MKKYLLLIPAFFFSSTLLYAASIPAEVQKAFTSKFPGALLVKWDKENAHEYEASFTYQEKSYSANFNDKGEWLETETTASYNQLPDAVKLSFEKAHAGKVVRAAAKIETAQGIVKFEVEYKTGVKTSEVQYFSDGSLVK